MSLWTTASQNEVPINDRNKKLLPKEEITSWHIGATRNLPSASSRLANDDHKQIQGRLPHSRGLTNSTLRKQRSNRPHAVSDHVSQSLLFISTIRRQLFLAVGLDDCIYHALGA